MANQVSRRAVMGAALAAVSAPAVLGVAQAQDKKGQLSDESLGALLKAAGIDAKLNEKRYDFVFKSTVENEDWNLSMSTVLSADGTSIWIMAWLDELPKSAADVPRTALLRLLSDNDKLGKGKFFAWIPANRRFVLQRVIPNEGMTARSMFEALNDLGGTVVLTYPHWSVANWNAPSTEPAPAATAAGAPVRGSSPQSGAAPKQAVNDAKLQNGASRR